MASLTAGDAAQIGSAVFTALAALAALVTVARAEKDRWDRMLPSLHVESIHDFTREEVRLTVVNYGGPAREVRVAGVGVSYGFSDLVGPTSYWRPGESRTILVQMEPIVSDEQARTNVVVVGRDIRMRYVLASTARGDNARWAVRPEEPRSIDEIFRHFFPDRPTPEEVNPVPMGTVERAW